MIQAQTLARQDAVSPSVPNALLQKIGGIAALLLGVFYAAFLAAFLVALPSLGFDESMFYDPPRFVAFVAQHSTIYLALTLLGVLLAPTLVLLVRALEERMHATSALSSLVTVSAAFGYIGATIVFLNWLFQYAAIRIFVSTPPAFAAGVQASATFDMTNMGAPLALGVWTLLLSGMAIRHGGLPKWLGYFGVLVMVSDLLVLFDVPLDTYLGSTNPLSVDASSASFCPVQSKFGIV